MISRTITSTSVTALTVDTATQKVEQNTFTLANTYANEDKLLKALKQTAETETFKIVSIVSHETINTLYGMTVEQFMELASPLTEEQLKREEYAKNKAEKEA